jgi:hypothetical protein
MGNTVEINESRFAEVAAGKVPGSRHYGIEH